MAERWTSGEPQLREISTLDQWAQRGGAQSILAILLLRRDFSTRFLVMVTLEIPVEESWLLASGRSRADVEQELRCILAARLFELRRLTLAQAATMAGTPVWQFMEALSSLKISAINLSEEELADELARA